MKITEDTSVPQRVIDEVLHEVKAAYCEEKPIPLASYAGLMTTYALLFGGLYLFAKKKKVELTPPSGGDLARLTLASYKLSRVVTMSFIGSPLRAPFATRGKSLDAGEVQDVPRGEGLQRAVGSLLTCPFCFNVWSTTAFIYGHAFAPTFTRQVSSVLSVAAISDVVHLGYKRLRDANLNVAN